MTRIEKRTFCRVCEPACGLITTVEDGALTALRGDKDHPISKGFVCNKGIYALDIHNDPDRLRTPLKRTEDGFEPISWEQAFEEIAGKLRRILENHGPSALATYTGNPNAFNALYGPSFGNFARQLGVRKNFSSGTQDCSNKFAGSEAVFGTRTMHPLPDIDHSDFILILGENPAVSHMSFCSIPNPMQHLKEAEQRGARILYVNPREIESARVAGSVLKAKPDTDAFLLAEVYNPALYRDYLQLGRMDYLYDKVGLYDTLKPVMRGEASADRIAPVHAEVLDIESRAVESLRGRLNADFGAACGSGVLI